MSTIPPTAPAPEGKPAAVPTRHRGRTSAFRLVVAGMAAGALAAGSVAAGVVALSGTTTQASGAGTTTSRTWGSSPDDGTVAPGDPYGRFFSGDDTAPGATAGDTSSTETEATDEQEIGVVDVTTTLASGAQAAGTGMVLNEDGEVLTNHHVIEGATSIEATVVSTGQTYTAELVGANADADVAVLALQDADGLDTVQVDTESINDAGTVAVGDAVTGVGNAGGDGGSASAAPGQVTALDESITTSSQDGTDGESLTGLIQVDADIRSGDSGGPLYDADGEVIGMNTAASVGAADVTGYAVPIATALRIVEQVEDGDESGGTTLGYPAFLGVELAQTDGTTGGGATLAGVVDGSAAADAGLAAGDVITAVGGRRVGDAASLSTAIAAREPGDRVVVVFRDDEGEDSATVTLGEGPAA